LVSQAAGNYVDWVASLLTHLTLTEKTWASSNGLCLHCGEGQDLVSLE